MPKQTPPKQKTRTQSFNALKTALARAQQTLSLLKEQKLLADGFEFKKTATHLILPLAALPKKAIPHATLTRATFQQKNGKPQGLKSALEATGKFSQQELSQLISSFDTVGDIAILDIPKELEKKEELIAKTVLESNNHIKVVAKKLGAMKGKYRVRGLEIIAGEKRTRTIYKESNCLIALDLATVFFSPRLSFERDRTSQFVKPNSNVLVLFAGVGPFALVYAKKQPSARVAGIELNPKAIKFFEENIALNNMQARVKAVKGDVNKIVPQQFANWADYIAMPAPHTATDYLDSALAAARKGCIITFYGFERTDAQKDDYVLGNEGKILVSNVKNRVLEACKRNKKRCKILSQREARSYAPNVVQKAIDFKML